jgi:hypothetical protein
MVAEGMVNSYLIIHLFILTRCEWLHAGLTIFNDLEQGSVCNFVIFVMKVKL